MGRIEDLVTFSLTHPWRPQWSRSAIERFLKELISDQRLIFDIDDEKGRALVVVL